MKKQDHILVQRVLEGGMAQREFARFQERLRSEPELAELYREYALLHHSLCEEFEGVALRKMKPVRARTNVWPLAGGFAAAAAIAVVLGAVLMRPAENVVAGKTAALVEFSEDAVWSATGRRRDDAGGFLLEEGGKIDLIQGRVRVSLATGATGVVEGPAKLEVENSERVLLTRGRGFFRLDVEGRRLEVATPSLRAIDLGTAFGVDAHPDRPDELHVLEGEVKLVVKGRSEGPVFSAGEAARVGDSERVEKIEVAAGKFAAELGDFGKILGGGLKAEDWRPGHGEMRVEDGVMKGADFEAFLALPELAQAGEHAVVLATIEVLEPEDGEFHTPGWSGMSFFREGREVLFFGDTFGAEGSWALDVKQELPVVLPESRVAGPRVVTMRYERRTGMVTLHEGGLPLGPAFCRGWLERGAGFDEIRLGAAPGAALAVGGLEVLLKN